MAMQSTHHPRCGARSKRTGKPCRAAAMPNGRCKVHGGKSTGPRTPEGLEAQQASKLETRLLLSRSEGGTVARAGGNTCAPLSAHVGLFCARLRQHLIGQSKIIRRTAVTRRDPHTCCGQNGTTRPESASFFLAGIRHRRLFAIRRCLGLIGIFAHESPSNILKSCCFTS
jgi:hypothetical protein